MKKYLLIGLAMPILTARAAVITWDGEGADGFWNNAVNWSSNALPAVGDDVVLDNSAVLMNYSVSMPAGNIAINIRSLLINPQGSFIITLVLPSTNTADPGLMITGPGDALVLNDRAILKNSSGASTGAGLSIVNIFRINNGGRYIHNTGRSNASIVNQLSIAAGTETGIFEYDVPVAGYTISLTGRTYGSLVLSAAARGSNVSYSGNGSTPVRIRGEMRINSQATLSSGMSADFIIQKNVVIATGAVFNCQNGVNNNLVKIGGDLLLQGTISKTGTGLPVVELNGLNNQHINAPGNISGNISLRINNGTGITLESSVRLPYHLQLVNGKISTSVTSLLTLVDNAVCSGASANSFIEGPLKKEGDDDFIFPVGKGQIYAPVRLEPVSNSSPADHFTVEYIRSNPQSGFGINYPPAENIDHISFVEYWNISSITGLNVSKLITLAITCESFCKTSEGLFIAGYDTAGAHWLNKGQSNISFSNPSACPVNLAGTITAGPVNSFSHFTLGSSQPFQINPLPIRLISFYAVSEAGNTMLSWEMAEASGDLQFEIERAGEDKRFNTIGKVTGNQHDRHFSFADKLPAGNLYYYRLKWKKDGELGNYSRIVVVNHNNRNFLSMLPAIVSSSAGLSFVSNQQQPVELLVVNMLGQVMLKQLHQLPPGNSTLTVSFEKLPRGIYQLVVIAREGKKETIRFTKL